MWINLLTHRMWSDCANFITCCNCDEFDGAARLHFDGTGLVSRFCGANAADLRFTSPIDDWEELFTVGIEADRSGVLSDS
jgi:hypothetical protein